MKTALLISGQPRNVVECYENIKQTIIEPNNTDVFIHSWIDPNMTGKEYYSEWLLEHKRLIDTTQHVNPASTPVPPDVDKIILNLYKPKKYLFEEPIQFVYNSIIDTHKQRTINPQNGLSFLNSLYKVNELKTWYEKENNFTYDVVMRIRFDCYFVKPIELYKFNSKHIIYIPVSFNGFTHPAFIDKIGICDHWNICNSELMNLYASAFLNVESIVVNHNIAFQNEHILGYNIRHYKNPVEVALIDVKYFINKY